MPVALGVLRSQHGAMWSRDGQLAAAVAKPPAELARVTPAADLGSGQIAASDGERMVCLCGAGFVAFDGEALTQLQHEIPSGVPRALGWTGDGWDVAARRLVPDEVRLIRVDDQFREVSIVATIPGPAGGTFALDPMVISDARRSLLVWTFANEGQSAETHLVQTCH
jgi:hypothetical protein